MNPAGVVRAALFFAAAIVTGELTFGNPDFVLTVWYFPDTPAWQWSLPVHTTGFLWLLFCRRLFREGAMIGPVVLATLFFLIAESLNWYVLAVFQYGGSSTGTNIVSFWVIIAMYVLLCTATLLILRWRPGDKP